MQRAITLIEQNLPNPLSVPQLAKAVGLSRAALARHFQTAPGQPPKRYSTLLRLRHAAHRLATSEQSLAQVAAEVGYSSEFAFSRAFKRHYHMAPGVYRQQWQRRAARNCEAIRMAA